MSIDKSFKALWYIIVGLVRSPEESWKRIYSDSEAQTIPSKRLILILIGVTALLPVIGYLITTDSNLWLKKTMVIEVVSGISLFFVPYFVTLRITKVAMKSKLVILDRLQIRSLIFFSLAPYLLIYNLTALIPWFKLMYLTIFISYYLIVKGVPIFTGLKGKKAIELSSTISLIHFLSVLLCFSLLKNIF